MMLLSNRYNRLFLILALAGLLLFVGGCERNSAAAPTGPQALPVKVQRAELQSVGDFTEYIATLKSRNSAILQPEVEGQVTRILVKAGDQVSPGQTLMEIDPQKQQATVSSQEANRRSREAAFELASKEMGRRKLLYKEGVTSKQDLDQAQSAYDAAKADVDSLEATIREQRVQLRYYTVKAPSYGTVGDIPIRVGDRVTNATVLTTLDKGGELEAYISVPSEKSNSVRVGLPVEIIGPDDKPIRSTISFVSPRVDPTTQLLLVKALVTNGQHQLRNDQVVHAHVIWAQTPHPVIPVTAVARIGGQMFAYIATNDGKQTVAKQRLIHVGEIVGNNYVILDGVQPGEQIIVTGIQMLGDGMPVVAQA